MSNIEIEDQFCYLRDMLSASSWANASSIIYVRTGWKKFKELLPILTSRVFSHNLEGRIYEACVKSTMLCDTETRAAKREDISRLQ